MKKLIIINGPNLNLLGKREPEIYGDLGFEFSYDGIILNAAAYTHTSVGIGDAVKAIKTPVIEVHISNTFSREEFRHKSYISPNAKGVILGFGLQSYELAILSF